MLLIFDACDAPRPAYRVCTTGKSEKHGPDAGEEKCCQPA